MDIYKDDVGESLSLTARHESKWTAVYCRENKGGHLG